MKNIKFMIGLSILSTTASFASLPTAFESEAPKKENSWVRFCNQITYPTKRMGADGLVKETFEALYAHPNPPAFYKALVQIWETDIRFSYALNEDLDKIKTLRTSLFNLRVEMTNGLNQTGSFSQSKTQEIQKFNRKIAQISSRAFLKNSIALIDDEDPLPDRTKAFVFKNLELFSPDEPNQLSVLSEAIASDKALFDPNNKASQRLKPHKYHADSLKTDLRSSFKKWAPYSHKFAKNRLKVLMGLCTNDWMRSNILQDLQAYFNEKRKSFPLKGEQFSQDQLKMESTYASFYNFKAAFDQNSKKGMVVQTLEDIQKFEGKLKAKPTNEKAKKNLELLRANLRKDPLTYVLSLAPTLQTKRFMAEAMGYELTHLEAYLKDASYFPRVNEIDAQGIEMMIGVNKPISNHNILQILKTIATFGGTKLSANNSNIISELHMNEINRINKLKDSKARGEHSDFLAEPTPHVEFWAGPEVLEQLRKRLYAHITMQ